MNHRQKDNLTDFVEGAQRNDGKEPDRSESQGTPKRPEYQVVDSDGDIITLGQNGRGHAASPNNKKVIELSPELIAAIVEAVRLGVKDGFAEFEKKWNREKL